MRKRTAVPTVLGARDEPVAAELREAYAAIADAGATRGNRADVAISEGGARCKLISGNTGVMHEVALQCAWANTVVVADGLLRLHASDNEQQAPAHRSFVP